MATGSDPMKRRRVRLLARLGLAAALTLPLAACNPDVPATPTYDRDVQPILTAHCVRCHGAGGTLNPIPGVPTAHDRPQICYLQTYDNNPAGCTLGATGCQQGAGSMYCAGLFPTATYVNAPFDGVFRMPPKPADPLSQWEKDVLTAWGKLSPPPKN